MTFETNPDAPEVVNVEVEDSHEHMLNEEEYDTDDVLVRPVLDEEDGWGVAIDTGPGVGTDSDEHPTPGHCFEEREFTQTGSSTFEQGGDNNVVHRVECTVCGREFEYVYRLLGLWSVDKDEYVWEN